MKSALEIFTLVLGCVISLLTFWHDVRRREIARNRTEPVRLPPFIHVGAAVLTGYATWQLFSPTSGMSVAAIHLFVAYVVVRPLLEH